MGGDLKSTLNRRSSRLFGIHSESKDLQDLQQQKKRNRRFTIIAATSLFLLILTLMVVAMVELYTNSTIPSLKNQSIQHLDDMIKAEKWNMIQDIVLEPQLGSNKDEMDQNSDNNEGPDNPVAEERWDFAGGAPPRKQMMRVQGKVIRSQDEEKDGGRKYPNHRYHGEEAVVTVKRAGWQPRPFTMNKEPAADYESIKMEPPVKLEDNFVNPEDMLIKSDGIMVKPDGMLIKPDGMLVKPDGMFVKPMWFRGYYVQPKSAEPEKDRNDRYHSAINSFFRRQNMTPKAVAQSSQNDSHAAQSDSKSAMTFNDELYYQKINDYFQNLRPYREDSKDGQNHVENKIHTSGTHTQAAFPSFTKPDKSPSWNRKNTNPQQPKPFTVMLDIYPVNKQNGDEMLVQQATRPQEAIYIPMRPHSQYFQPMIKANGLIPTVMTPPKRNRMVMKLNLFPKAKHQQRQRRTWNLWGGEAEEEDKCWNKGRVRKPMTAKWKEKNGEWVHAKFVTLHDHGEDRMDYDIDPR